MKIPHPISLAYLTYFTSESFKIGEYYVVVLKKSENGVVIKPFFEVKDEIERGLKDKRFLEIKSEKIDALKLKYKAQVNLIDDVKL